MVACLRKKIAERDRLIDRWAAERVTLAKLAAETPQFYNPLDVADAKRLRDHILSNNSGQPRLAQEKL
jgi:chorismate mutase